MQVVRTAQYGCNCRGMGGNGGCGEFDIVEAVIGLDYSDMLLTTVYDFKGTGSSGENKYFLRPSVRFCCCRGVNKFTSSFRPSVYRRTAPSQPPRPHPAWHDMGACKPPVPLYPSVSHLRIFDSVRSSTNECPRHPHPLVLPDIFPYFNSICWVGVDLDQVCCGLPRRRGRLPPGGTTHRVRLHADYHVRRVPRRDQGRYH